MTELFVHVETPDISDSLKWGPDCVMPVLAIRLAKSLVLGLFSGANWITFYRFLFSREIVRRGRSGRKRKHFRRVFFEMP
jgi:hypothetical protein